LTALRVARRADAQIRDVSDWWAGNRTKAPELFAHELADVLAALTATPQLGNRYAVVRGVEVRRIRLRRSRYHVYFDYDEAADMVTVRAVWHASRGHGPTLQ
jgi:plasmid stabilization system protein ParE